jgi:hypothetical protein
MKLTLPHIVSYLVTAIGWIAALNPSTAESILGPTLGKFAPPIIALAGSVLVFAHDVGFIGNAPAPAAGNGSATKQGGFIRTYTAILMVAVVMGSLVGCKLFSSLSTPAGQVYVTDAAEAAVLIAEGQGVPGSKINALAKQVLAADAGVSGTLASISSLVNAQLGKLNLPPQDVAAAQILEAALNTVIAAKIGNKPSLATAQAAVADVANAVIAATGG